MVLEPAYAPDLACREPFRLRFGKELVGKFHQTPIYLIFDYSEVVDEQPT